MSPVCKTADNGRLTVDQKVKVVLYYAETKSVVATQRRFRAHFGTRWAPCRQTIYRLPLGTIFQPMRINSVPMSNAFVTISVMCTISGMTFRAPPCIMQQQLMRKKNRYFSAIPFCSRRAAEKTGWGESGKIQGEETVQCLQYYITLHHLPSDKCQVYLRTCKRALTEQAPRSFFLHWTLQSTSLAAVASRELCTWCTELCSTYSYVNS